MRKFRDTPYFVTEDGKVFRNRKQKKPDVDPRGYSRVTICQNAINKRFRVHRIVAELYVDNPHKKEFVNHKDGNPRNNHYSNLEWVTPQENSLHATRVLKKNIGLDNIKSKLTPENVQYIREHCIPGDKTWGYRPLGRMFDVNKKTIKEVFKNLTWIHIP
jgi:hypothetical protein